MLRIGDDPKFDVRHTQKAKSRPWDIWRRLLAYSWLYKGRLVVSLVFALVVAVSFTSMIFSVGGAINLMFGEEADVIAQIQNIAGNHWADWLVSGPPENTYPALLDTALFLRANPMTGLLWICIVLVILSILAGAARFLQEYFAGSIGVNVSVLLGEEMYENMMRMSLRFFEERDSGEILARFTNDIFMVNRGLAGVYVKLLREPLKAFFFLAVALSINPLLTGVGLLVLPPVAYIIVRVGKKFKKSVRRSLQHIAGLATVGNETIQGIQIVKSFCMEEHETARIRSELRHLKRYLNKMVKADAAVGPFVEVVLVLGIVGFIMVSGHQVVEGTMQPGDLVALYLALAGLLDPVRKLSSVNNMVQTSLASAERVFEFIDMTPDIVEAPNAASIAPLEQALEFRNVCFSYDGKAEVLRDISFQVNKGEMVALVGFSGAGKSTVAKLIPRFYDVTNGAILIDGVDIRQATFKSLRGQIGMVTQNTVLFNETISENIAFGGSFPEDRVREAAKAAHAQEFIEKMPKGYDTVIGEQGYTLSGGQRQRLAIARALVKDPAILILDEATSSLDADSEQAIQRAIDEFVVGRTTIVIAHRLSTILRADRILVINEGRIEEEGTHQELITSGAIYRRLYEVQFRAHDKPDEKQGASSKETQA